MKKIYKKILSVAFALALLCSGFVNYDSVNADVTNSAVVSQVVSKPAGQRDNIQDGVTLHCWNWSYKNIEANMELIAASGYTAIQTSPIQQSKEGTKTYSMDAWWLYYQPMGFHIDNTGNSALGTKAEFISMCNTAHQYGVKVIVDIVANHTGNQTNLNISSAVPSDLRDDPDCWHYEYGEFKNTGNYNSRYEVTQFCMNGIPDLNTSNPKVQNYVIGLLKECIDAGADGFRFDAAKHIEVPIDTDYCASDFWPNVINAATDYATQKGKNLYCYGELLDWPGGDIRPSAYTPYMSVTDNGWSNSLRHEVSSGNAAGYASGYGKGNDVYANKLVLWAESHDTFAGGESKEIHIDNINKTWALVAARNDAMGLYFARPSSTNLNNVPMGTACVTGWSDAEVVEANKFHNAFAGQTEYIANENGIAYCVRGNAGVVLVSCGDNVKSVNVDAHGMKDGKYIDQVTGSEFEVTGGRIKGEIGARGVAVVYNPTSTSAAKSSVAYIELPSNWGSSVSCYVYGADGTSNAEWPGVKMTKVSGNLYKYEVPSNIENPRVIFYSSDSNRYPADLQPGLSLYGEMVYKNGIWSVYNTDTSQGGNSGSDNSGSGNSGGGNSGSDNSGSGNSGGGNSGSGNSGSDNSGSGNSGSGNSGSDNSGSGNSGSGNSGSGNSGSGNSGSGNSGGGNSGSENSGNDNSGNDNSGDSGSVNDSDKPSTDTDNKDDDSEGTVADDNNNSDDDNNIEETTDKGSEKETGKDGSGDTTDPTDDIVTIGPSSADEGGSDADGDNKDEGKKFPWPAVVIPIIVLGVGAGVFAYIKGNKGAENN